MVDVGDKPDATGARSRARSCACRPRRRPRSPAGDAPKGDVLGTARIAGIQAAKRTGELIPLCHPLGLTFVDVEAYVDAEAGAVTLTAEARTTAQTGVEMEAMTAAAVAALTVYDMVKGLERGVADRAVALLRSPAAEAGPGAARDVVGLIVPRPASARRLTIFRERAHGDHHDLDPGGAGRRGLSGPRLAAVAEEAGADVVAAEVLPDDKQLIEARLTYHIGIGCSFVFTTGGTGFTHDDVTPGGHARGHRPRSSRLRRGDARGVAASHAAGHPHPRRVGHRRSHPDHQLPRQPQGHRRALPGHRPDSAACARDVESGVTGAAAYSAGGMFWLWRNRFVRVPLVA